MKKRIIIYSAAIALLAVVLMFALGLLVNENANMQQASDKVISLAEVYASVYDGDNSLIVKSDDGVRVTVVSATGEVLVDTDYADVSALENHMGREEILAALNNSPKACTRTSDTTGKKMMYYALKDDLSDGGYVFIRVSLPVASVDTYLVNTIPLTLCIMFGAVMVCCFVGLFVADKVTKPFQYVKQSLQSINDGNFTRRIPTKSYDEINGILSEINDLGDKLQSNLRTVKEEDTKLNFVINNILDAVIAVDANKNVCLINSNACRLFDCGTDAVGKSASCLSYDKTLFDAIERGVSSGENSVFETEINKSFYLVTVKTLKDGWKDGEPVTTVILSDVTAAKANETMRSEFFANASHELKTPLTSIKGFNEIVSIKNKDVTLVKPIEQIGKEAERMLALIEDMLRLSRLENTHQIDKVDVDVISVANEVKESLTPLSRERNVEVSVEGSGKVSATHEHVYELVKNLAENAVKYSNDGGKVQIKVVEDVASLTLTVADDGIGIDGKDQSRIFERFYRVEKSRSRLAGGTGLGLSIVKHVCVLYGAELTLKSKIGLGTTVTVVFNK